MKKLVLAFGFMTTFLGVSQTFAAIENFKVDKPTASSLIQISWNGVSNEVLAVVNGYALQRSPFKDNIHVNKTARHYIDDLGTNSLELRAADFEVDKEYYFRVYTYTKEGRTRVLSNGSKMITWKVDKNGKQTVTESDIADPSTTSTTSSSLSNFGTLRSIEYDTFVDFKWSRPNKLTTNEYDGYAIEISDDSNFSNILGTLKTSRSIMTGRILGLEPEKTYYARGNFYKTRGGQNNLFGRGTTLSFKTIKAINRNANSRASRNIKRIEKKASNKLNLGTGTSTATTSSSSAAESTTSTSSSSSSASLSSTLTKSNTSTTEIEKKINELQDQIKKLQSELSAWQRKLRNKKGGSTVAKKASTAKRTRTTSASSGWKIVGNKKCRTLRNGRTLCRRR